MFFKPPSDFSLFKRRRKNIIETIKTRYQDKKKSLLLLCAGFEGDRVSFHQESSFYYLTGINEPAVVACCHISGPEVLYIPKFDEHRSRWVTAALTIFSDPKLIGFDEIKPLGGQEKSYFFRPIFSKDRYEILVEDLKNFVMQGGTIFVAVNPAHDNNGMITFLKSKFHEWIPGFGDKVVDITSLLEETRRIKDEYEIGLIHNAAQLTMIAQEAAAKLIEPGKYEYEIQAMVEYVFRSVAGTSSAFPSIVATGKNTTVLHYTDRTHQLKDGELVVVDIGASYGNYAADITRTYPVSGVFTTRQREVYHIVLEAQAYIESIAAPGMFVRNDKQPEKSLHHHAVKFFQKAGYDKYFYHGVSHFLGLDVHDVGAYDMPLSVGDVFTIEPGIYIPEENIGVRIEDDYVLVDDGVVCLSNDLAKAPADIEALMADKA